MSGIPLILISILSALTGIFFGVKAAEPVDIGEEIKATQHDSVQQQYIAPDIFFYPLHEGNKLIGYSVIRFVLPLAVAQDENPEFPDETMLSDAFYSAMFSMRSHGDVFDALPPLDMLTSAFINAANASAGYSRYDGALLQQFDYFEPNAMRRKNVHDRNNEATTDITKPQSTH